MTSHGILLVHPMEVLLDHSQVSSKQQSSHTSFSISCGRLFSATSHSLFIPCVSSFPSSFPAWRLSSCISSHVTSPHSLPSHPPPRLPLRPLPPPFGMFMRCVVSWHHSLVPLFQAMPTVPLLDFMITSPLEYLSFFCVVFYGFQYVV